MILTKKSNIKAFTIFELLITMLITSLLITLIISLFFRFNEFFLLRKKQWEDNTEVLRFIKTLGDDIDKSESVAILEQSMILKRKEILPITYMFKDEEALRISGIESDTFCFDVKTMNVKRIEKNPGDVEKFVLSFNNERIPDISVCFRKEIAIKSKYFFDKN